MSYFTAYMLGALTCLAVAAVIFWAVPKVYRMGMRRALWR